MDLRLVKLLVSKSPDRRIESREVEPREISVCQLWSSWKQAKSRQSGANWDHFDIARAIPYQRRSDIGFVPILPNARERVI
jgi:hypothetical protein